MGRGATLHPSLLKKLVFPLNYFGFIVDRKSQKETYLAPPRPIQQRIIEYVYCSASYNALFLAVREDSRADSEKAPGMQFKHR
jgi:hypothetical protein